MKFLSCFFQNCIKNMSHGTFFTLQVVQNCQILYRLCMKNQILCDKKKMFYENFKIKCGKIALLLHIKIGKFVTLSIIKITLSELSPLIWQSLKKSNANQTQTRCF